MLSVNPAGLRPATLEYDAPKSRDAAKATTSTGTTTVEATSKTGLANTAKLTAALMTLQKTSGAQDFSKPFEEVVSGARAALDSGYQKLGKSADFETTPVEWDTIGMNKLDRRSLYAISSNQGGLFSQAERDMAQYLMTQQVAEAMTAADPLRQNPVAAHKAAIAFYDNASPEEKSSKLWAQGRASAQAGYEQIMKSEGRNPKNVDSGNPYVDLFVTGYDELFSTNAPSQDVKNMPSYLKAMEL